MSQVVDALFAQQFLQRLHGAANAHDADAVAALCCAAAVFETAGISRFEGGLLARQVGAVPKPGSVTDIIGMRMQIVAAFWSRSHRDPIR